MPLWSVSPAPYPLPDPQEFLDRAAEAQAILDARPKFPDADRYRDMEVEFFGRSSGALVPRLGVGVRVGVGVTELL